VGIISFSEDITLSWSNMGNYKDACYHYWDCWS